MQEKDHIGQNVQHGNMKGKTKQVLEKGQIKRRVGDTQMSALESLQVQGRLASEYNFKKKS